MAWTMTMVRLLQVHARSRQPWLIVAEEELGPGQELAPVRELAPGQELAPVRELAPGRELAPKFPLSMKSRLSIPPVEAAAHTPCRQNWRRTSLSKISGLEMAREPPGRRCRDRLVQSSGWSVVPLQLALLAVLGWPRLVVNPYPHRGPHGRTKRRQGERSMPSLPTT